MEKTCLCKYNVMKTEMNGKNREKGKWNLSLFWFLETAWTQGYPKL